eukprot:03918_5
MISSNEESQEQNPHEWHVRGRMVAFSWMPSLTVMKVSKTSERTMWMSWAPSCYYSSATWMPSCFLVWRIQLDVFGFLHPLV